QDINRLINRLEVVRLNFLNILSALAAKRRQKEWTPPAPTLRERIVLFVKQRTAQTSGPLELVIRMRDLGSHLGATRSLISMVLHDMEKDGVLSSNRGSIYVPDIATLH
ncbi:MAG: helix-turn-helix domain-containing protein, partial [Prevotellaceae bacterium]|nr:helix-turn-helix domain-containing protein [Prevotellaceae bacterium]